MPRVAARPGPSISTFPSFAETFRASDCTSTAWPNAMRYLAIDHDHACPMAFFIRKIMRRGGRRLLRHRIRHDRAGKRLSGSGAAAPFPIGRGSWTTPAACSGNFASYNRRIQGYAEVSYNPFGAGRLKPLGLSSRIPEYDKERMATLVADFRG
jgi:hypothetical protein